MGCCYSKKSDSIVGKPKTNTLQHTSPKDTSYGKKFDKSNIRSLSDLCKYINDSREEDININETYMIAISIKPIVIIPGCNLAKQKGASLAFSSLETQSAIKKEPQCNMSVCLKMNTLLSSMMTKYTDDDKDLEDKIWKCMSLMAYIGCKVRCEDDNLEKCKKVINKRFYTYDANTLPLVSSLDIHNLFSHVKQ